MSPFLFLILILLFLFCFLFYGIRALRTLIFAEYNSIFYRYYKHYNKKIKNLGWLNIRGIVSQNSKLYLCIYFISFFIFATFILYYIFL